MSLALAKLLSQMQAAGRGAKAAAPYALGATGGFGAALGGDALLDEMYPARKWVPKALQGPLMDAKSALEDEETQRLLLALGIPLAGGLAADAFSRWKGRQQDGSSAR